MKNRGQLPVSPNIRGNQDLTPVNFAVNFLSPSGEKIVPRLRCGHLPLSGVKQCMQTVRMRARHALPVLALLAMAHSARSEPTLPPEDLAAAFSAAGFSPSPDGRYIRCQEDPPTLSYMPGASKVVDLNGDGNPEVWITESSLFCYGNTGSAFVLLTRDGDGWRTLLDEVGMQQVLDIQHFGWPDIEVGGPGFGKFPVYHWNGQDYQLAK